MTQQKISRDELEAIFSQLGISTGQTQSLKRDLRANPSADMSRDLRSSGGGLIPTPTQEAPPAAQQTGFFRQFSSGVLQPFRLPFEKLAGWEKAPEPVTTGGKWGRGLGSLVGWTGMAALTAATLGKIHPALAMGAGAAAAGKMGVGAVAGKSALTGAVTSGYRAWGTSEETDWGEISKQAALGAGIGAVLPVAFHGVKKAWHSSPVVDATSKLRDVLTGVKQGKSYLAQNKLPEVQTMLHKTPQDKISELYSHMSKRATERGTDHYLANKIKNFNNLNERQKLEATVNLLQRNPDDKVANELLRPVFRYMNRVSRETSSLGDPRSLEYQNTINKLGNTEAVKGVNETFGIKGKWLRSQIGDIDNQVHKIKRSIHNLYDEQNVYDATQLRGSAVTKWENYQGRLEMLEDARLALLPTVEQTLGKAKSGEVGSWLWRNVHNSLQKARGEVASPYEAYHPKLQEILHKHGVAIPEKLSSAGRQAYNTTLQALKQQGEKERAVIGWSMNPLKITPDDYKDIWKELHLVPNVATHTGPMITATSLDDAILAKPATLWAKYLAPIRRILGEPVAREVRSAKLMQNKTNEQYTNKIHEIMKPLMGRKDKALKMAEREKITEWLWERRMDSEMSKETLGVAKKVKELFRTMAKEFGVSEEDMIRNYAPHLSKGGAYQWQMSDRVSSNMKPFFEYLRNDMVSDREMDILPLLRAYASAGSKSKHLEPTFKNLDKLFYRKAKQMTEAGREIAKPELRKGVDQSRERIYDSLKHRTMGWPTQAENFVDNTLKQVANTFGILDPSKRYTKQLSELFVELQYGGTIAWNPFSAVKNTTQQLLAIGQLDKNPLVGLDYWSKSVGSLFTKEGKNMAAMNFLRANRAPLEMMNYQRMSLANIPGLGGVHKAGFKGFEFADRKNLDVSFNMKMFHALDKGKPLEQAVEEAYTFTMATQFAYGTDSPLLYHGPVGKMVGALMSWPLNWASLLWEQGTKGAATQAMTTVAAMVIGSEALSLTGLNFRSTHPAKVASGILPVAMLDGEENFPMPLRMLYSGTGAIRALAAGDDDALDMAWRNFSRTIKMLRPYEVQRSRIQKVWDAYRNEFKVEDSRNRISYEMTPRETITGLFGPTVQAQQRMDDLNNIKSQQSAYRRTRRDAIDSFLDGDYERFAKIQHELQSFWGVTIEPKDIEQEIDLRGMTALERRAIGLPKAIREPMLERIQFNI